MADALSTPIAAGEYHYGIVPFRHLLEARSIDIVMIDLLRVGGITQWMKVAGMAEAFNLPVVSHLIPEIHVHLVAAIPNGLTVEYMPWTLRLYEETPAIEGGQLVVPKKPGLGLAFDQAAIKSTRSLKLQAAQKGPDARRRPMADARRTPDVSVRPRAPTKQMGLSAACSRAWRRGSAPGSPRSCRRR